MNLAPSYININKPYTLSRFALEFERLLKDEFNEGYSNILILCIGTDRSTGDSLGPLIGQRLRCMQDDYIRIYGTLDNPVHAKNLTDVMEKIRETYRSPFIIGVDACLGKSENIGCISLGKGPVRPGAGVNKKLPEVGDVYIMGIVNVGGFMEYLILQNTRLSLVMKMANIMSAGIYHGLNRILISKSKTSKELNG